MYRKLIIKSFQSIEDEANCILFTEGYAKVLESYGAPSILAADTSWYKNPAVYVVLIIEEETGNAVGGARIELYDTNNPLPTEKAIGGEDPKVGALLKKLSLKGLGETCRVWNSKDFSGSGLSQILIRSCVAKSCIVLASQLELNSLIALCAPWTMKLFKNVGFVAEESVGANGEFMYPRDDLIATLMILPKVSDLNNAEYKERAKITALINNPNQIIIEQESNNFFEINYQLRLNKTS